MCVIIEKKMNDFRIVEVTLKAKKFWRTYIFFELKIYIHFPTVSKQINYLRLAVANKY